MGYRSEIALVLTANGVKEMRLAISKQHPDTQALVTDFLDNADKHSYSRNTQSEAYMWDGVKWYYGEPDIDFFENFMRSLDEEDYRFIRLGEDYDDIDVLGCYHDNPFDITLSRNINYNKYLLV